MSVRPALVLTLVALLAWAAPATARISWEDRRVVSPDGSSTLFKSFDRLTAEDSDSDYDLFVYRSGDLRLVSTGPTEDPASTGEYFFAEPLFVSDDGWRVIFETAQALTAADTDRQVDVYARDRGKTELLSTGPTDPGAIPTEFFEHGVHLDGYAADGRATFFSTLGRLVAADTDSARDVYKREDGVTTLISTDAAGRNTSGAATFRASSADGSRVFFYSTDPLVAEDADNGAGDYYMRVGTRLELVSKGTVPGRPLNTPSRLEVTPDGLTAVFDTPDALEPNDNDGHNNDVYQRSGGTTRLLSVDSLGLSAPCAAAAEDPRGVQACDALVGAQSDDGRDVVWDTAEPLVPEDRNTSRDLYGSLGGQLEWISAGAAPDDGETAGDVSLDGGRITFTSAARLVPEDRGLFTHDVYQRVDGRLRLVTELPENGHSELDSVSEDGRRVFFHTWSSLVPEDTDRDYDLYEWEDGVRRLVSTGPGAGTGESGLPLLLGHSADGSVVVFRSDERLTADDLDDDDDVYMRAGGQTTLLSAPPPAG
ncbi:MAG: hypothetical protein M3340_03815 [Actinomycetota bacterium]|nr:hypothetical protein [Actinomycetota bacterium]